MFENTIKMIERQFYRDERQPEAQKFLKPQVEFRWRIEAERRGWGERVPAA